MSDTAVGACEADADARRQWSSVKPDASEAAEPRLIQRAENANEAQLSYPRAAAILAICSAPISIACLFASLGAANFDLAALGEPTAALQSDASSRWIRWAMVFDLFGYYLFLAPAVVRLHAMHAGSHPEWSGLFAYCGLAYVTIGACGAGVLAAAWPPLIEIYQSGGASAAEAQLAFKVLSDVVHGGLWNSVEVLLAGVWWTGIGVLCRPVRPAFGNFSVVLGGACLLLGIATLTTASTVTGFILAAYLGLSPIWATWFGVLGLRHPGPDEASAQGTGGT